MDNNRKRAIDTEGEQGQVQENEDGNMDHEENVKKTESVRIITRKRTAV